MPQPLGARGRRYDEQQAFERALRHVLPLFASARGTCVLSQVRARPAASRRAARPRMGAPRLACAPCRPALLGSLDGRAPLADLPRLELLVQGFVPPAAVHRRGYERTVALSALGLGVKEGQVRDELDALGLPSPEACTIEPRLSAAEAQLVFATAEEAEAALAGLVDVGSARRSCTGRWRTRSAAGRCAS